MLTVALTGAAAPSAPSGISARGTIAATVTMSGTSLPISGQIALYRRAADYRLDLLSLGLAGVDPAIGALAAPFLAPGGITVLFASGTNTYTAYSNATRRYVRKQLSAPAAADPLSGIGAVIRNLGSYQAFAMTTTLLGHATVNGHPANRLGMNLQDQRTGGSAETIQVQLALADDLDGFPVQLVLNRTGGQGPTGSATIDITSVDRTVPDATLFAVPAGFTQTDDATAIFRPPGM